MTNECRSLSGSKLFAKFITEQMTKLAASRQKVNLKMWYLQLSDLESEVSFDDNKLPETLIPALGNFKLTSPVKLCVVKLFKNKVSIDRVQSLYNTSRYKKVNEYDQEIPHSHNADQPNTDLDITQTC